MVRFNELIITPDSKQLIIQVSISSDPLYNDVYIDKLIIDTQDTYVMFGPSSTPVYSTTVSSDRKSARFLIKAEDLSNSTLLHNLFFIYVTTRGLPTPPAIIEFGSYNVDVVANLHPLYKTSIKLMSNIEDNCKDDNFLIDLILKVNALETSLKTCNYPIAIKYWNKYFKKLSAEVLTNNCKS